MMYVCSPRGPIGSVTSSAGSVLEPWSPWKCRLEQGPPVHPRSAERRVGCGNGREAYLQANDERRARDVAAERACDQRMDLTKRWIHPDRDNVEQTIDRLDSSRLDKGKSFTLRVNYGARVPFGRSDALQADGGWWTIKRF